MGVLSAIDYLIDSSLCSNILAQWFENKRPCVGFLTVPVVLKQPFYVTMRTNVEPYD